MSQEKKQPEPEEKQGAPDWMVTYSDCVTLLMTFFVLLFSFASINKEVFEELAMAFGEALSSNATNQMDRSAFLETEQIVLTEHLVEGSEKVTLEKGLEDNLKKETDRGDFRRQKVFLTSSKKIFFGRGMVISSRGRKVLSVIASFLKEVPDRIVISENQRGGVDDGDYLGLERAWATIKYLTGKQGLDKGRFSISAAGTISEAKAKEGPANDLTTKSERTLEIVLLERSIYN